MASETPLQDKKRLSKAEKKAARKQAKSQHLLLKHDGISSSDVPSKFLLVGNGGLLNGIQRDHLSQLFSQYGEVDKIVMLPGKPYSFVCFQAVEGAILSHEHLQGYVLRAGEGPTNIRMYLSYVTQVPKTALNSSGLPPGLFLIEDFIDEEMEHRLVNSIQWESDIASAAAESAQQSLKHRRVKHHGYEFLYTTNNIDKNNPLPDGIPTVYERVIDDIMSTEHVQCRPDQLTINQYQPGQGIPAHIDTHSAFEDAIISLSLGSQVVMDFSHPDGRHVPVLLPARCLVVMTRESRYLWSHGITPRKSDIVPAKAVGESGNTEGLTLVPRGVRTSLTFRAIRRMPCNCDYPSKCDSQQNAAIVTKTHNPSASLPSSEQEAILLEKTHVHEVYEKIAEHFSDTRHKPWPRVAEFLNKLDPGGVVVDIGCGNGKYLGVNSSLYMVGCDMSQHLVDICRQRQFQAFISDALVVPIRSESVDACVCIAVVHHFSTQVRREKAVAEMVRILNPGGLALIYVWAVEQERDKKKSNYLKDTCKTSDLKDTSYKTSDQCIDNSDLGRTDGDGGQKICNEMDREKDNCGITSGLESVKLTTTSSPRRVTSAKPTRNMTTTSPPASDISGDPWEKRVVDTSNSNDCNHIAADNSTTGTAEDPWEKRIVDTSTSNDCNHIDDDKPSTGTTPRQVGSKNPSNTLPVHKNRTQFVKPDLLVPWHLKIKTGKESPSSSPSKVPPQSESSEQSVVYHRYYHVFKEGELETLCLSVGRTKIVRSYYDQGNWCVIFQKQ